MATVCQSEWDTFYISHAHWLSVASGYSLDSKDSDLLKEEKKNVFLIVISKCAY